jgi:hypothetical protein
MSERIKVSLHALTSALDGGKLSASPSSLVWSGKLLLVLGSTVILEFKSSGIHDHILLYPCPASLLPAPIRWYAGWACRQ